METLLAILGGVLLLALAFIKALLENKGQMRAELEQEKDKNEVTEKILNAVTAERVPASRSMRSGEF